MDLYPRALRSPMQTERATIVLKVRNLTESDRESLPRALMNLEGVCNAAVDVLSGVVRVDGAASDSELLRALSALGKQAVVVTHTRGAGGAAARPPSSSAAMRAKLFLRLLKRNANCCS